MSRFARLSILLVLPLSNLLLASGARAEDLWITNATLIDGTGAPPRLLVPTLAVMSPLGDPRGDDAESIALQVRTHQMRKPLREVVRKAKALGIVIAAATDGTYGDGEDTARIRVAHEIEELVACGFTPMEALVAATTSGARVLGIDSRTGKVAVGLEADLLVVDRNPLEDTTTLFEPMLVVTDGRVVLNRLDR